MPTRRTATLLTIMRPERGHGTEAQSLSQDSAGLRRYKSQSAILYWIRRRRRAGGKDARAGGKNEPLQVQASLARTLPRVNCHRLLLKVTLSPPAIVISWSGPSLSAADQGRVIGWDEDTPPSCYSRRGLSSPGAAGASTRCPPRNLATRDSFANGKASRQSNRAQIVRLSLEPAPSSFRLSYDGHYRILSD